MLAKGADFNAQGGEYGNALQDHHLSSGPTEHRQIGTTKSAVRSFSSNVNYISVVYLSPQKLLDHLLGPHHLCFLPSPA